MLGWKEWKTCVTCVSVTTRESLSLSEYSCLLFSDSYEFDDKIRKSKNAIEESNINNPSFIYNQVKEKEMNYKPQLNFKRALASSLISPTA